jgi:sporulation protein YlmC with PRC-barrel domain
MFLIALAASTALMTAAVVAQTEQPAAAVAAAPLTVSSFKNQDIYTAAGKVAGTVVDITVGDDGQQHAIVDFGKELGMRRVPISSFIYQKDRFTLSGITEEQLQALPSHKKGEAGFTLAEAGAAIKVFGWMAAASGEASIIVQHAMPQVKVQEQGLAVQVEQAPPQVTVHQPTPQVNVRQLQPVIIVRQPPPKVIIEQTQPEIIVRMPEPEVNVSMAEPQVMVNVPKPDVQVIRQEPKVAINAAQAVVSLLPRKQAEVGIQSAQPQVHYERIGEPQIIVHQAEGGPQIRFEKMTAAEALQLKPQIHQLALATDIGKPALPVGLLTSQIKDKDIYNLGGEKLGVVNEVLMGPEKKAYFVVEYSDYLGLGPRKVLLPADNFALQGDRLAIPTLSDEELKRLPSWNEDMEGYTAAAADGQVPIGTIK